MSIQIMVDLRDQFGEIRDQGKRPTCMAFAASDAHAFARGNHDPLSVEFAHYHAVQKRTYTNQNTGVSLDAMSEALLGDGQPLESGWPYIANLRVGDTWAPPTDPGEVFYRATTKLSGGTAELFSSIDAGKPVIVVMGIGTGFFDAKANEPVILNPGETSVNTHAVIAIGWGEHVKGRCCLIRNSWGVGWGDEGNAWIHEDYLQLRLCEAALLS